MKCQITEQPIKSVFCDSYSCRNRAAWRIGNPDGPGQLFMQLCHDCATSLIESGKALGLGAEVFACEHCNKEFDNEKSCKMHSIRCPERKEEGA